jgi:hypothetical protein
MAKQECKTRMIRFLETIGKTRLTKYVNQTDSMLYQLSYEANTRFTSVGLEPTTVEVMESDQAVNRELVATKFWTRGFA